MKHSVPRLTDLATQPATWIVFCAALSLPFLRAGGFLGECGSLVNPLITPSYIEANRGQASPEYSFYSKRALFSDQGLTMMMPRSGRRIAVRLAAAKATRPAGQDPQATRVNYFIGTDRSKWITDVPTFGKIRYADVYPGIAAVYYPSETFLEQDFEVAAGVDPGQIRMRFDGADSVKLNEAGGLTIATGEEHVDWQPPQVYQGTSSRRKSVRARYEVFPREEGDVIGFALGDYDRTKALVIDPVITFSTYIGRSAADIAGRTTVDAQGNVYLAGATFDPTFPVVSQTSPAPSDAGTGNAVLVKMNASGTQALTVTHFGGSVPDMASAVALDADGNIYLTGYTESPDFPTTLRAIRNRKAENDKSSCFITKFNAAANRILYSTYLGGDSADQCMAIAIDTTGAIYVTGSTESRDFPSTPDTFQPSFRAASTSPGDDGFVTKLNPEGTAIVYSTFIGGSGHDYPTSMALDAQGNVYIAGSTTSLNFPVTQGALQTAYRGASAILGDPIKLFFVDVVFGDAFVTKINRDASAILYSTYLGGREDDVAFDIAVDAAGNAYVSGATRSADFPVTAGVLQPVFRGGGGDARYRAGDGFVTKLGPDGRAAVYSTYLGGTQDDRAAAIAVDSSGNAWVTGHTLSSDFPVSADARQRTNAGSVASETVVLGDAFITQLDAAGAKVLYSTYYGGSGNEAGYDITVARDGAVLVTGATSSRNFPTTPGVFQPIGGIGEPRFTPFNDFFLLRLADAPAVPSVAISSISNEATGGAAAASIAPGTVIAISGENLALDTAQAQAVDGYLPKALKGTRVLVNDLPAALLSISPAKIVAIVPFAIESSARVIVEASAANRSAPVTVKVVEAAPAIYATDGSGAGLALAVNEDGSAHGSQNPAMPGSVLTFVMTGAGKTESEGEDGRVATPDFRPFALVPATVAIGDAGVEVLGVQAIDGQPLGRFGVAVRIPADAAPGLYPLLVRFGAGEWSQEGISVQVGPAEGAGLTLLRGRVRR